MIKKETGVEIVPQVNQKAATALDNFMKLAAGCKLLVLGCTFLLATDLDEKLLLLEVKDSYHGLYRIIQTLLCLFGVDGLRWCILLHMHKTTVAFVDIDCDRILRDISIIKAVTVNILIAQPAREIAHILAQSIGDHLRALTHRCCFLVQGIPRSLMSAAWIILPA